MSDLKLINGFPRFSLYAEPNTVIGEPGSEERAVWTGLGAAGDEESALIGMADDGEFTSINLSREELTEVIVDLVRLLALMDGAA